MSLAKRINALIQNYHKFVNILYDLRNVSISNGTCDPTFFANLHCLAGERSGEGSKFQFRLFAVTKCWDSGWSDLNFAKTLICGKTRPRTSYGERMNYTDVDCLVIRKTISVVFCRRDVMSGDPKDFHSAKSVRLRTSVFELRRPVRKRAIPSKNNGSARGGREKLLAYYKTRVYKLYLPIDGEMLFLVRRPKRLLSRKRPIIKRGEL